MPLKFLKRKLGCGLESASESAFVLIIYCKCITDMKLFEIQTGQGIEERGK